jgi:hypothetical protein
MEKQFVQLKVFSSQTILGNLLLSRHFFPRSPGASKLGLLGNFIIVLSTPGVFKL